jgi:hypothetical protein
LTEIGFAPKEVITPQVCRLEVLDADKADTYGPQIYLKLKVVGGEHDLSIEKPAQCGHGYPGGKGCYLCDPRHPYRFEQGGMA